VLGACKISQKSYVKNSKTISMSAHKKEKGGKMKEKTKNILAGIGAIICLIVIVAFFVIFDIHIYG